MASMSTVAARPVVSSSWTRSGHEPLPLLTIITIFLFSPQRWGNSRRLAARAGPGRARGQAIHVGTWVGGRGGDASDDQEAEPDPYRGPGKQNKDVGAACTTAIKKCGGFFGPYVFNVSTEL